MANAPNLIILNDSSEAKGGATALAIESALGAAASGWNVSFITQNNNNSDPRLLEGGVRIVPVEGDRVNASPSIRSIKTGMWNKAAMKALENEIARMDISRTVFHVHNWSHFLSPSIFSVLREHFGRVVITPHDFFLSCGNGGQFNYRTDKPCGLVGNSAKCLVTACDKSSQFHKFWRIGRLGLLRSALGPKEFTGTINLIHPSQKLFLERAEFNPSCMQVVRNPVKPFSSHRVTAEKNDTILFIGRFSVEKGAEIAARAARDTNRKIIFCGDGPLLPALKKEFTNAEFKGFCTKAELSDLIQKARLVLIPSKLEAFGLVAVEAIWSGVPVIINQTALIAQDIAQKNAGISWDFSNYEGLIEVIEQLFQDDSKIRELSICGYEKSEDIATTHAEWLSANLALYKKRIAGGDE